MEISFEASPGGRGLNNKVIVYWKVHEQHGYAIGLEVTCYQ
jgi:hypothetical protein